VLEEHNCENSKEHGAIYKKEDVWFIVLEEYGDHVPIKYCPYCGEVL
jgi:hypothetical protein